MNVPISPVSRPRLVRNALAADGIVTVAEALLAGPVAPLARHGYALFDGLRQFADAIFRVVAALDKVMALVQTPLHATLPFAEA